MSEPLIIVGAGGHARETAYAFLLSAPADRFIGFLDDRATGSTPEGWPVLGSIDSARLHPKARFLVAINDPRTRRAVVERLQRLGIDRWGQVLHPELRLHSTVRLGVGCSILGGCQLTTSIRIGNHCILNRGSQVSHDCTVADWCSLSPGACVAGNVQIAAGCELGSMSSIRQGLTISEGSMVGMGAVVAASVAANTVVVGSPARVLRSLSPW
jgi:sugar O-acyltransferase (sialic acid O-acetyltransferase NeuD family)